MREIIWKVFTKKVHWCGWEASFFGVGGHLFLWTKIGFLVSVFSSPRAASRATSFYVYQVGPPCFMSSKQQNAHKYRNQHDRHHPIIFTIIIPVVMKIMDGFLLCDNFHPGGQLDHCPTRYQWMLILASSSLSLLDFFHCASLSLSVLLC